MGSEVISADSAKFFHSFTFLLIFLCSCAPKHSYQVSKRNSYTELNGESWENLEKKITQLEIQNLALKFERRWLIARNKLVAAELELNLALSSKAKLQAEELKYINEIKGKNSSSNNDWIQWDSRLKSRANAISEARAKVNLVNRELNELRYEILQNGFSVPNGSLVK